jgi:hypothetical protein
MNISCILTGLAACMQSCTDDMLHTSYQITSYQITSYQITSYQIYLDHAQPLLILIGKPDSMLGGRAPCSYFLLPTKSAIHKDKTSLSSINAKTINTCDGLAHPETICRQYKSSIYIDSSMLATVKHVFNPVNIQ